MSGMRKATPPVMPPLERLALRICKWLNSQGTTDATAAVAVFSQRTNRTLVDAAFKLSVEKQWLRYENGTYFLTKAGTELGSQSRSRRRIRRVSPF
jgi:hypothetical protein